MVVVDALSLSPYPPPQACSSRQIGWFWICLQKSPPPSSLPETVGKIKRSRAQNCYNEAGTDDLGAAERKLKGTAGDVPGKGV